MNKDRILKAISNTATAIGMLSSKVPADVAVNVAIATTNMIDQAMSRRDALKLAGKAGEALAVATPFIKKLVDETLMPKSEGVGLFAGYPIGEAGTGQIFSLDQVLIPYPIDAFALQGIALEGIHPESGKKIGIKVFNMNGLNKDATIGISYELDPKTEIPNGRTWLVLSYSNVWDETSQSNISVLKPLGSWLAPTLSMEMHVVDSVVDDGYFEMGPDDGAGGITPIFVFQTEKPEATSDITSSVFLPFFPDMLESGPIEAPKSLIKHARVRKPESPAPALSPEIVESAQAYFGENFEITPEGKVIDKNLGTEIQGFSIVPFNEQTMIPTYGKEVTWGWQRVYEFEGKTDFTVVGTEADITVTEDGGLDMYAWGYKNGEFTRQKVEFAAPNNGTVELEGFSPQEVQQMIITNSSTDPRYRVHSTEALRQMAIKYIPKVVINRNVYTTYKNMLEPQDRVFYYQGNNFIPILNSDSTWSAIETTEFMIYSEFNDRRKALVVWIGADNKPVVVVMETKYAEDPKYFNSYWQNHDIKDPFTP